MRGFFSFFTVLAITFIGIYIMSVNSAKNTLVLEQDETQIFADTLFYSKMDASNSFWRSAGTRERLEKWGRELEAGGFEVGFGQFPDASGTQAPSIRYPLDSRIGEAYRVEDFLTRKCPIETTEECVMVTNCRDENCRVFEGTAGFYSILERDGARIQFSALQGEYEIIELKP